jgi:hypothetical protein
VVWRFCFVRNLSELDVCGGSARQSVVADVWSDGVGGGKSRRFASPVRAMGEETMWITAGSAVALVVALAAFAALGGYLLSMGVDNAERSEVRNLYEGSYDTLELHERLIWCCAARIWHSPIDRMLNCRIECNFCSDAVTIIKLWRPGIILS